MGLMTLQGGMSLRCGWYSTTTMEAGSAQTKLRKLPLPCPVDHMSLPPLIRKCVSLPLAKFGEAPESYFFLLKIKP